MKPYSVGEVLRQRTKSHGQPVSARKESIGQKDSALDRQLREVDDQNIDGLVGLAVRGDPLTPDQRQEICLVIGQKGGHTLNKQVVGPLLSLLYCRGVVQLSNDWSRCRQSFFVLTGELRVYQLEQVANGPKFNTQPSLRKTSRGQFFAQEQEEERTKYQNIQTFNKFNRQFSILHQYGQYRCIGNLFKQPYQLDSTPKTQQNNWKKKLIAIDAVVVAIPHVDRDVETVFGDGLSTQAKMEELAHFPVLQLVGRKLISFISAFRMKRYSLKETIYKEGDTPSSVYFMLKGQVSFEVILKEGGYERIQPTETVAAHAMFGEDEIVFKGLRAQTARVTSTSCVVLELDKEKFVKMLDNVEFKELISQAALARKRQRQIKIEKARMILQKQREQLTTMKDQVLTERQLKQLTGGEGETARRRISQRKGAPAALKVMHGNVIRNYPKDTEEIHFSMLGINPDHYQAVKKKYRHYNVKPELYQPSGGRNFKQLWKVFNLQDVLREQEFDVSDPSGRKFFDTHRRLSQYVRESRSLRPKTSSSGYRTKMQYIAYLQQFNH